MGVMPVEGVKLSLVLVSQGLQLCVSALKGRNVLPVQAVQALTMRACQLLHLLLVRQQCRCMLLSSSNKVFTLQL